MPSNRQRLQVNERARRRGITRRILRGAFTSLTGSVFRSTDRNNLALPAHDRLLFSNGHHNHNRVLPLRPARRDANGRFIGQTGSPLFSATEPSRPERTNDFREDGRTLSESANPIYQPAQLRSFRQDTDRPPTRNPQWPSTLTHQYPAHQEPQERGSGGIRVRSSNLASSTSRNQPSARQASESVTDYHTLNDFLTGRPRLSSTSVGSSNAPLGSRAARELFDSIRAEENALMTALRNQQTSSPLDAVPIPASDVQSWGNDASRRSLGHLQASQHDHRSSIDSSHAQPEQHQRDVEDHVWDSYTRSYLDRTDRHLGRNNRQDEHQPSTRNRGIATTTCGQAQGNAAFPNMRPGDEIVAHPNHPEWGPVLRREFSWLDDQGQRHVHPLYITNFGRAGTGVQATGNNIATNNSEEPLPRETIRSDEPRENAGDTQGYLHEHQNTQQLYSQSIEYQTTTRSLTQIQQVRDPSAAITRGGPGSQVIVDTATEIRYVRTVRGVWNYWSRTIAQHMDQYTAQSIRHLHELDAEGPEPEDSDPVPEYQDTAGHRPGDPEGLYTLASQEPGGRFDWGNPYHAPGRSSDDAANRGLPGQIFTVLNQEVPARPPSYSRIFPSGW